MPRHVIIKSLKTKMETSLEGSQKDDIEQNGSNDCAFLSRNQKYANVNNWQIFAHQISRYF